MKISFYKFFARVSIYTRVVLLFVKSENNLSNRGLAIFCPIIARSINYRSLFRGKTMGKAARLLQLRRSCGLTQIILRRWCCDAPRCTHQAERNYYAYASQQIAIRIIGVRAWAGADGPKDLSNRSAAYNLQYHLIPAIERITHPCYTPLEYSLAIVNLKCKIFLGTLDDTLHTALHRFRSPCNSIRSFIVAVVRADAARDRLNVSSCFNQFTKTFR